MQKCANVIAAVLLFPLLLVGAQESNVGDLRAFDHAPPSVVPPTPAADRRVGIAYSTWHRSAQWGANGQVWGTPLVGYYRSDERPVIRQHARWLSDAGVDFIWIDWSNDIKYIYDPASPHPDFDVIEGATFTIFDEYAKMRAEGASTPQISIFIGTPGEEKSALDNGHLQRKADQVWNQFVANPNYRPLVQEYLGKPLLVVYLNTPTLYQVGTPPWGDPRFTVRYMTGYVTQQPHLVTPELVSKYGYWSWEDRGPQTYSVVDHHPEEMTIVAAWRGDGHQPTPGRAGGETFRKEWERARLVGPRFAMVVSWNEWSTGEQPSPEISKDIEPSKEFGLQYLTMLKEQIGLFKAGK